MPVVSDYTALLDFSWSSFQVRSQQISQPHILTFSFDSVLPAYVAGYDDITSNTAFWGSVREFSAEYKAATRSALDQWASISGLTFIEVPAGQGDLRFYHMDLRLAGDGLNASGLAKNPNGVDSDIGGDVKIAYPEVVGTGTFLTHVLLHEIGHALGFKHPFETDVEGPATLDPALDNVSNTVMSYTGTATGVLGPLDRQAIQALYGPNSADLTNWSFNATTGVLTQTGDASANRIDGIYGPDSMTGGAGDDTLAGGRGADTLDGGDGNDSLRGTMGADLLFGGPGRDTLDGGPGSLLDGGDGSDQLVAQMSYVTAVDYGANMETAPYTTVLGGAGDDFIFAGRGRTSIDAGSGNDRITTGQEGGLLRFGVPAIANPPNQHIVYAGDGADTVNGGSGDDTVYGGDGNDSISGGDGTNFLRGELGNDTIVGGAGFDDIHGNQGEDSERGGGGDDWVVGGQGNDVLHGDDGVDIVLGNLGNDTCYGDAQADIVRGGQANDLIFGGAGNDYVSGDRGDDTVYGEAGADAFHGFAEAGIDRIMDFDLSQGDYVLLDPGTVYTLAQVGADTVIDFGGGNQMILVNTPLSSLTGDWIRLSFEFVIT